MSRNEPNEQNNKRINLFSVTATALSTVNLAELWKISVGKGKNKGKSIAFPSVRLNCEAESLKSSGSEHDIMLSPYNRKLISTIHTVDLSAAIDLTIAGEWIKLQKYVLFCVCSISNSNTCTIVDM